VDAEAAPPPGAQLIEPEINLRSEAMHSMSGDTIAATTEAVSRLPSRWGTSRNWSGAVIAARDGKVFRRVSASWTVPVAQQPADHIAARYLPGGSYRCSVWIGLDGYRFFSRSLPQVGTVSQVNAAGQAEYYLWVQWWVRGKWFGEVEIANFDVQAGDEIHAVVQVLKPDDVLFTVRRSRPGVPDALTEIAWQAGVYEGEDGVERPLPTLWDTRERGFAPVEGRHAVFCVERPAVMPPNAEELHERGIEPDPRALEHFLLPRLGDTVFRGAKAEMRAPSGRRDTAELRDLTAARRIRMIERLPGPGAGRIATMTSPQGMDAHEFGAPFDRRRLVVKQR
jgi:hypothetical protein